MADDQVAVVMAVRDVEQFVGAALDSLVAQTHEHWTCVVVDDASVDGTAAVVAAHPDPRISLLRHDEPRGSGAARNWGLRHVPDDVPFVAYLDGDDLWLPDALEGLVARLTGRRDAVGAYGLAEYVDARGDRVREGEHSRRQQDRRRVGRLGLGDVPVEADATFDQLVLAGPIWPAGVALHRRAVVERVGGFDEALRLQQDWDLYLRMSRTGPFAVLDQQVAWYRQHGTNVTSRTVDKVYFQDAVRLKTWASPANTPAQRRQARRAWRALLHRRLARTVRQAAVAATHRDLRHLAAQGVSVGVGLAQLVRPTPPAPNRRLIELGGRDYCRSAVRADPSRRSPAPNPRRRRESAVEETGGMPRTRTVTATDVGDGLLAVDRATQLLRRRLGLRPDAARQWLRDHAEQHGTTLVDAARALLDDPDPDPTGGEPV